jgi:hypothetical protein
VYKRLLTLALLFYLAHRYRTAARVPEDLPLDMCEELVGVCLNLLDFLQKGTPQPRRHTSVAEYINEANKTQVHFGFHSVCLCSSVAFTDLVDCSREPPVLLLGGPFMSTFKKNVI